ncbi:glycosyltransferase family 2 protein [Blautia hydrogenotrophica]|uniref:glycosyltransferase family 2 protein n=1 Tax=Blautia hydrogenotrophica TaxID=53443 RepID=UPI002E7A077E|nr:glycosyltransferase family 2 protein [Blautia hydrogenotrophica]MEE0462037.1 glycosyltransferase family 2 protein [Blautia hydrogenotrophica]
MGNIIAVVDVEKYVRRGQGEYVIQGWRASEDSRPIEIQVRGDEVTPIAFRAISFPRPDVLEARPELAVSEADIGFQITISNVEVLLQRFERVTVRLRQGEDSKVLVQKERRQMAQEYRDAAIRYQIDVLKRDGEDILLQGWCIDTMRQDQMSLTDEKGRKIDCTANYRIVRSDVIQEESLEPDYACGFVIEVPRKKVCCSKMVLKFWNDLTSKQEVIDMKEFDYKNSVRGRVLNVLKRENKVRNLQVLKSRGVGGFVDFVKEEIYTESEKYAYWWKKNQATAKELKEQTAHRFAYEPKISIVIPLFNTPEKYLKELIDSVVAQSYGNWELCLADGSTSPKTGAYIKKHYNSEGRIVYRKIEENLGISGNTNFAISMGTGEFIMFCDHDDVVAPNALYEMVKVINEKPKTDIVYTDEDLINSDGTVHSSPRFKPDFNFDFLRSINYICHIFLVRKSLIDRVGMLRKEFDGAQDYDFILRCCEQTEHIAHVPKVLYHWRAHDNSTAGNPESKQYAVDAGKRALEEHYRRMGYEAVVENTGIFIVYRTIMKVQGNPKVSVIILNKDHREDLEKCVVSIEEKTDYPNYEIIVVENNSELPETFAFYEELQRRYSNVKVVTWDGPFNYSAINNYGAEYATGDYYLMLNNDIEVISPGWMSEMLGYCQREDVGIVGAKLYYSDDTVQHAGVVVGVGGFAGHVLTRFRKGETGYFGRLVTIQDTSAVTAACLMIKKSIYQLIGGFDEEFVVALNDIDLCLKVRALGQLVVFNPYAELYHYESKSRGFEDTPEKKARFKKEIKRFREKWGEILSKGDPYYNPNLTLVRGDCSIRSGYEKFEIVEEIEKGIE